MPSPKPPYQAGFHRKLTQVGRYQPPGNRGRDAQGPLAGVGPSQESRTETASSIIKRSCCFSVSSPRLERVRN